MLQNSMVAGIDLTSPRRSAGLFSGTSVMLISCWKTPQSAGNSLFELQDIQTFLGGACPQPPLEAPTFGGRLG
jgi:hypothetical protein